MKFIQSQKNKHLLKYNCYLYRFYKTCKNTIYWRSNEKLSKIRLNFKK